MLNNYLNTCLSRYDLKLAYNCLQGINSTNKKVKLLCPTLAQIKQILNDNGYQLYTYRYINDKKIRSYYIIKPFKAWK